VLKFLHPNGLADFDEAKDDGLSYVCVLVAHLLSQRFGNRQHVVDSRAAQRRITQACVDDFD